MTWNYCYGNVGEFCFVRHDNYFSVLQPKLLNCHLNYQLYLMDCLHILCTEKWIRIAGICGTESLWNFCLNEMQLLKWTFGIQMKNVEKESINFDKSKSFQRILRNFTNFHFLILYLLFTVKKSSALFFLELTNRAEVIMFLVIHAHVR